MPPLVRNAEPPNQHCVVTRIFLAEDDPEMRRLVADALRKEEYEVLEACDGGQLLMRLASNHFSVDPAGATVDLIVTDVRMPMCSGLELVQALRDASWRIPVIIMTGFGDRATRERAASLDAVLIDKPFRLADLKRIIRDLLPATRCLV